MINVLLALSMVFALVTSAGAQRAGGFDDARSLISRVQSDLVRAADLANRDKEKERVANAQRSLSEVDKHLSRGKFHKDSLDTAIKDVQNVLDHNTLSPGDRDALKQDVDQLRIMREKRGSV